MIHLRKTSPNNLQCQLAKVIHSMINTDGVDFKGQSALGYGLSNYIAKYSLAKDYYLVSEKAAVIVQEISKFKDEEVILRAVKNDYPLTYEHAIPVNLIRTELLSNSNKSYENVSKILSESDIVVIITKSEDKANLSGNLKSKMPDDMVNTWTQYLTNSLARYKKGKIDLKEENGKYKIIKMRGAILR